MPPLRQRLLVALGVVGAGCAPSVLDSGQKGGLFDAIDADGDGETAATDCNDHDPWVYTGAPEACNAIDDDCDNEVDENVRELYFQDADGDGYGNPEAVAEACEQPAGHVDNADDCDDRSALALPGGTEICDGHDNDCDGEVDEVIGYFPDADGDGFGWPDGGIPSCGPLPSGYADNTSDCDDTDPEVNPDAAERCLDGIDNDCDGLRSCLQATFTGGDAGECTVTWALRSAETTDWTYPCPGCDFSFAANAQLELLVGDGPGCDGATSAWRSVSVSGDGLVMEGGPLVPLWTGSGSWSEDQLLVASGGYPLSGGLGTLVYESEVFAYEVSYYYGYEGRPFSVGAGPRVAALVAGTQWSLRARGAGAWSDRAAVELAGVSESVRERAAAAWRRAALAEHASVASFARFSLDLMRLGAPPELLRASARAAADEVRHAQHAFGIAGALGGAPVGPGRLDTRGALDETDVLTVFLRLLQEGCVDETVSAVLAREMRAAAQEPSVCAALDDIVEDEEEHALLAWRAARWMLQAHPWLISGVRQVQAALAMEPAPRTDGRNPPGLRALGVLHVDRRQALRRSAVRDLVVPGLAALARSAARAPAASVPASEGCAAPRV